MPAAFMPAAFIPAAFMPAAAGSARYGPVGGRFSAMFPSPPQSAANTPGLLGSFAKRVHAYAYWVSPTKNLFGTATVPPPPSFIVAVSIWPTTSEAKTYMRVSARVTRLKLSAFRGSPAYEFIGLESSSINRGQKLTDPDATYGFFEVRRGRDVYFAYAITQTRPAAAAFLGSFTF